MLSPVVNPILSLFCRLSRVLAVVFTPHDNLENWIVLCWQSLRPLQILWSNCLNSVCKFLVLVLFRIYFALLLLFCRRTGVVRFRAILLLLLSVSLLPSRAKDLVPTFRRKRHVHNFEKDNWLFRVGFLKNFERSSQEDLHRYVGHHGLGLHHVATVF